MRIMKCMNWTTLIAFASIGLMLPSLAIAEIEGLIDIDYPHAGEAKVEVNLLGGVFSLAAKIMQKEEPEVSKLLAKLEAVKVRIYDKVALDKRSFDEAMKFYKDQLKKEKWDVLARVKEKDSKMGVYSLTRGDIISGLVVLAQGPEELVVVNLAGEVDVTKLSEIDKVTGVNLDLSELNFKRRKYTRKK
jgi:hypothetical protein